MNFEDETLLGDFREKCQRLNKWVADNIINVNLPHEPLSIINKNQKKSCIDKNYQNKIN